MKYLFFSFLFLASFSAQAQNQILKECSVVIPPLDNKGNTVKMYFQVIGREGHEPHAKVIQTVNGFSSVQAQPVVITEATVRADLPSEVEKINDTHTLAELMIIHAKYLSSDADLGTVFTAGFDLDKVRNVTLYQVGTATDMGSTTIVEARDENQNNLGSFLGGFVVSPCL